jgi:hypothetical protein
MQQTHPVIFPIIGIALIVRDIAEQMIVDIVQYERLWIVLIIYIGEDPQQIGFLEVDVVELCLIGLVESFFTSKLHKEVEGLYFILITLGIAHLRE